MPQIKILIVDDDAVDREMIKKAISSLKAVVVEASNGVECLKCLKEDQQFGLIILDYGLPDYDGITLIKEIITSFPSVPIIIVTGVGSADLVVSTSLAGVLDYVPKDKITPEFLTRTILSDLLVYRSQIDKKLAEDKLDKNREIDTDLLKSIIDMAKKRLTEYDQ